VVRAHGRERKEPASQCENKIVKQKKNKEIIYTVDKNFIYR
jgi:hypothetical protein